VFLRSPLGCHHGSVPSHSGPDLPREVIDAFRFDGDVVGAEPVPGGHIHRNILLICTGGRYVVQRLNSRVFPDIEAVLGNVERIVGHLRERGASAPVLVDTRRGGRSFRDAAGSAWRAFHYLERTVGRTTVAGPSDAFETGRAFALYLVAMAEFPDPPLARTIDRFHDLEHRLATLESAAAADPVGRRIQVHAEIERARTLGRHVTVELGTVTTLSPVRIVHNDAKLSNVRFDAGTGEARCVVDFDTTMAGQVRHDVGELVRTTATHAPEDARDIATVDFDMELLDALASGYFAARPGLTPDEIASMALGGPEMAVENAVRFLTDHLVGDRYFAVDRPSHNLDRCRAQLRLTELMLEAHAESVASFTGAARAAALGPPQTPASGAPR
jgi:N-acetylhexosamine 1-kinase